MSEQDDDNERDNSSDNKEWRDSMNTRRVRIPRIHVQYGTVYRVRLSSRLLIILSCTLLALLTVSVLVLVAALSSAISDDELSAVRQEQLRQDLTSINATIIPFMDRYTTQYGLWSAERTKLQADLKKVQDDLATAKVPLASVQLQVAELKSQVQSLSVENSGLKSTLQKVTNESASWQQRFLQSQQTVSQLQQMASTQQQAYNNLYSKLTTVNSKDSDVVNKSVAADVAAFYRVWDEWWKLVIIGTD